MSAPTGCTTQAVPEPNTSSRRPSAAAARTSPMVTARSSTCWIGRIGRAGLRHGARWALAVGGGRASRQGAMLPCPRSSLPSPTCVSAAHAARTSHSPQDRARARMESRVTPGRMVPDRRGVASTRPPPGCKCSRGVEVGAGRSGRWCGGGTEQRSTARGRRVGSSQQRASACSGQGGGAGAGGQHLAHRGRQEEQVRVACFGSPCPQE